MLRFGATRQGDDSFPLTEVCKPHCGKQRVSRLRVRHEESRVAAALSSTSLRQGTRAEELRGRLRGATSRAHGRALAVCRGEVENRAILIVEPARSDPSDLVAAGDY